MEIYIYPVMPGRHACQEAKLHGHEVAGWDCQRFGSNFSAGQDELPKFVLKVVWSFRDHVLFSAGFCTGGHSYGRTKYSRLSL
jgi:hypothetical protein